MYHWDVLASLLPVIDDRWLKQGKLATYTPHTPVKQSNLKSGPLPLILLANEIF